jgi:hypothetical protein
MSNTQQERRSSRRVRVDISAVCSPISSDPHGVAYPGRIENCSRDGICIAASQEFGIGTVLAVRAVRSHTHCADHPDVPCIAITQVRWSHRQSALPDECGRVGLKYLQL